MKKLSRKEVFNLVMEALNEQDENKKEYSFGNTTITDDLGRKLMSSVFDSFNKDLGDHYYNILSGKEGTLELNQRILASLKSLFEQLNKNFYNEPKKIDLTEMVMSIINDTREKKEGVYANILPYIFEIFKVYYENNLKEATSELTLLSPKALGARGVSDNLNSDSKLVNFFNILGYFKKNPR